MAQRDPKRAILAHLAEQPVREVERPGVRGPASPIASMASGVPFAADLSTVRFVKERRIPGRRLYWLRFEDEGGQPWRWLVAAVESEAGGWVAQGGAGGSGRGDLERAEPWVNLAGWWGPEGLYAGGEVLGTGTEVATVRLRLPKGLVLEDDAEGGVALFLTDQRVKPPATVEICDRAGSAVATHKAL